MPDVLGQCVFAQLTPDARLFETAKRYTWMEVIDAIHLDPMIELRILHQQKVNPYPSSSGLELVRHSDSPVDFLGEDRCCEAIHGVIGLSDDV